MKYRFLVLFSFFVLISNSMLGQELNCKVIVVADQIVEQDPQIFKTLETSISDFINQTKWTDKVFLPQEKIECSILLTLVSKSGNDFYSGSIQVQSSRPIFNSVYTSPILNYRDEDLTFNYTEFEPLQYVENSYQGELIATLSFFANLILGLDADTFELNAGDLYYTTCQKIIDQVDNPNNKKAWKSNTNKFNRYQLLTKLKAPSSAVFRETLYRYHLNGLDQMTDQTKKGKVAILNAINALRNFSSNAMASQLIRTFMDAKADEIVHIFSGGVMVETKGLVDTLNKIAPTSASKWAEIK